MLQAPNMTDPLDPSLLQLVVKRFVYF